VESKTKNGVQRKNWEDCVQDLRSLEELVDGIQEDTVQLAKQTGLDKPDSEDTQKLMDNQGEEVTTRELMEIEQVTAVVEAEDNCDNEIEESAGALKTKG
jgi:hypothetical protein